MAYLYQSNLDSRDRSDQLEIQMDSGGTAILRMGQYYDLTAGELARARRYIVLISSAAPATETPIGTTRLPVRGTPSNGQIPIWDASVGAFVPGAAGSGGPPTGTAGGVLSGSYPNPAFAQDMATQAELDAAIAGVSGGGSASDASTTVKGVSKLSVAPATSTNPIAAGTNDTRLTADQAAGTASIRTLGTGAAQAAAGNHGHAASAISFTPGGTVAATDVQSAIAEVASESSSAGVAVLSEAMLSIKSSIFAGGAIGDGSSPTQDQAAFDSIVSVAGKRPVIIPKGTYRLTSAPMLTNVCIEGQGHLETIIQQDTLSQAVLVAHGEGVRIAELTLRHPSLPTAQTVPNGVGIRCRNLYQRSVLERLLIENCTVGIYCKEAVSPDTTNGIFSTTIRDSQVRKFVRGGIELSSVNAGNTGCVISNIYMENWNVFQVSKLTARHGYLFQNFDDLVVQQINCEWGIYDKALEINSCPTVSLDTLHIEGYEQASAFGGIVGLFGNRNDAITLRNIHMKASKVDAALTGANDVGLFRIDDDPIVFIDGLFGENNTKVGTPVLRRFYCPAINAAARVYFRGDHRDTTFMPTVQDFFSATGPPHPLRQDDGLIRAERLEIDGSAALMQLRERASGVSNPATDHAYLWVEDNGAGKTRLMARFQTGAAVQIAIEP